MSERSITIHVKKDINLARLMAAIFRQYEPSINSIIMKGVDTPLDVKVLDISKKSRRK